MKNRQDRSNNNNDNKNYKKKKQDDINFIDINANDLNHLRIYGSDILLRHGAKCTMNMPNIQQE
jgi:hypothetical protein